MPVDPPATTRDPDLAARLDAAYAAMGPDYVPRTHCLDAGRARYVNRLILEASPYLLQHAHNPVDWRPWGDEVFAEAAARNVPVFLSVGYATCHWCHVMEEESFDDEGVAALLNAHFVPVKLDREARPDLDQIYITATQLQQGHAGWPNSVWLMPDGRPFHTGTYFPKPHFMGMLNAVAHAWTDMAKRPEIEAVAERIEGAIRRQQAARMAATAPPQEPHFASAVAGLARMFNEAEGGFSENQQFPQETFLLYALDRWRRDGDTAAKEIAERTLDAIAAGGIHDHVGGGFHRYTVDVNWRTPHFEKMLYNQGALARAFVEGWEATGKEAYARAARRCLDYVIRDMTDPSGAFYAAEDADSLDGEGRLEEGAFYVWAADAAREALGADGDWAVEMLGLEKPWSEVGPVAHLTPGAPVDFARLDGVLERLRSARDARPRPLCDTKIIAGWNGLMIRALADGAAAFGIEAYAAAAARAAEAVWARQWDGARLARLYAGGGPSGPGMLEDYAWLGIGFLALFDATGEEVWIARARDLGAALRDAFDDGAGRLKMAAEDGPMGPIYDAADGATPAGESSALVFLACLGALGDAEARIRAEGLRAALSGQMSEIPLLRPEGLIGARLLGEGASGLRRTVAEGALRLRLSPSGRRLDLALAPGWHLTAASGAAGLAAPVLRGAEAVWPAGVARRLGFADRPIEVLEGALTVPLTPSDRLIEVSLQVCSDTLCRAPEVVTFRLP